MTASEGALKENLSSLIELLQVRARELPNKLAYRFLHDGEVEEPGLTYAELDARARAIGALLQTSGATGERVLLLYPSGLEFVAAFLGCLYGGAVAVPTYPPRSKRSLPQLAAVIEDARPKLVMTSSALLPKLEALGSRLSGLETVPRLATDRVDAGMGDAWTDPGSSPETLAFLQYTSGATATPKGVMVSHGNLLNDERMIRSAFDQSEDSVVVSWLPLYHDMGLIGGVLQPLYAGARCILMSPGAFLQQPGRWLAAITRYQATTSGGPNFAYDLCARRFRGTDLSRFDLASWRLAFNGSEPVRAGTLERFARTFEPCGFRPEALYPCYGLAEATLFVTGGLPPAAPVIETVDRTQLERGRVSRDAPDGSRLRLVGCGRTHGEQDVAIVDRETRTRCAAGRVGEIWVAGPNVARGYWNRPEVTAEDFQARLADAPEAGRFLRTGDLGFLAGGELFVTGRLKDLIIVRGRNLYPQDVELTAERCHPAARPGGGAAFSIDRDGEERLVVAHELERHPGGPAAEVAEAIRRAVAEEHEVAVHEVVVLRIGALPKTSSGKIRRQACRADYLGGAWKVLARSGTGAGLTTAEVGPVLDRAALLDLRPAERRSALEAFLRRAAALAIGIPEQGIEPHLPLSSLGLDSLAAVELEHRVQSQVGVSVSLTRWLTAGGLDELADRLSRRLEDAPAPAAAAVAPEDAGDAPLTYSQRALWFVHRLAPASAAYNLVAAMRVRAPLDTAALRHAVDLLVERHAALRTTFHAREGEPMQRVHERLQADFVEVDAGSWSREEMRRQLHRHAYRPFDLETGPLLRVRVWRRSSPEAVVLVVLHHIVTDFWSMAVLARELGEVYTRRVDGRSAALEPLAWSFLDVVERQRRRLAGGEGKDLWTYWRRQLDGASPSLALATDRPRPPVQTYRGAAVYRPLGSTLSDGVQTLSRRHGTTPFVTLLAVFQTLLHRTTGRTDLVVGAPAAGRDRAELAGSVGYFVNPLALRADFSNAGSFQTFLAETRERVLGALAHESYPLPLLAERLHPERDPSRSPLFQVMFVWQKTPRSAEQNLAAFALGVPGVRMALGRLAVESVRIEERAAPFDLTLSAAPVAGSLVASLRYNTDLFDRTTARRMLGHFRILVQGVVADAERPIAALPLLTRAEAMQLSVEWNRSAADRPSPVDGRRDASRDLCLHQLFEIQAERRPDATALVFGDERLSYRQLNVRANRLAHALAAAGAGPEVRVGVCLERTPEMVVALLAVLKAGSAYVPLDPSYPPQRLAYMLRDSTASVLLSRPSLDVGSLSGADLRRIDPAASSIRQRSPDNPPGTSARHNLAYVIYTSGSTGQPKGVAIEHRSPVALVRWSRRVFTDQELNGVLAATSICFDLSIFELFVPLSRGGKVILVEDPLALPELPAADETTLVNTVPSAMAQLTESRLPAALTTVNLAGEPLPTSLVRQVFQHRQVERLLNLYGPTEDTTYSTFARLEPTAAGPERVTIGRPLSGTRAYLLDRHLKPAPVGNPGEIFLAGAGLARGYLGHAAQTAERFIPDPFAPRPGDRLYTTGDLARYLPVGELEFLGRVDHQVKLRGFRIELGEIEAVLTRSAEVREAVVLVRQAAASLVAYVVPREAIRIPGEPAEGELVGRLKKQLEAQLPAYMVPAHFVLLEDLPRTPNGKVDRVELAHRALPEGSTEVSTASRTPVAELLAGSFAELLHVERVADEDSFFDLGGHSLLATQLVSRIRACFGVEMPLSTVFAAPTVAALARRVEKAMHLGEAPGMPPIEPVAWPESRPTRPLSFAQQRMWVLHRMEPESAAYNLPLMVRFKGPLAVPVLLAALNQIPRRHEVLQTTVATVDGKPRQVIAASAPVQPPLVDLRALPVQARRSEARRLARNEAARPFDLEIGPLWRGTLVALSDGEHELVVTMHHIVSDGWSMALWARELTVLYGALAAGRSPEPLLPELAIRYADYAVWQRRWLSGKTLATELAYWRRQLGPPESGVPALDLSTDRLRPPVRTDRGASRSLALTADLVRDLEALSRGHSVTLYMTLLATLQVVLGRYAGQSDVAVGTPIAGRTHQQTEALIGFFANTLVLRTDLSGEPSFARLLRRVRAVTMAAYAHQHLPFEKLVEELQPRRDLSRTPLFQVMLAVHNAPLDLPAIEGLDVAFEALDNGTTKFDFTLFLEDGGDGLAGKITYSRDLFDGATLERLGRHFRTLLEGIRDGAEKRLSELPMHSAAERHQLSREWNATATAGRAERCVHRLVEAQARRTPEAPAVIFRTQTLTYGELDDASNRLARHLRQRGAAPEETVAVCLDRSADLVVAVLGALKTGGAYLPLDPSDPPARLRFVLSDARTRVLVTEERLGLAEVLRADNPLLRVVCVDRDLPTISAHSAEHLAVRVTAANLAYVLYTSGSTGRAKGVRATHENAANYLHWAGEELFAGRHLRLPMTTRITFDASLKQLFSPLLGGGAVRVLPEDVMARPEALLAALGRWRCQGFNGVPSLWEALLTALEAGRATAPADLCRLYLGGEELPASLVARTRALLPDLRIVNLYGPTETTANVSSAAAGRRRPTLGRPLANIRIRILDTHRRLSAIGAPGELCVSGAGVARGYLRRAAMTARSFVPDPYGEEPGTRMYRTGDRARCLPDGTYEFLGRRDHQVKIRGFRIELGEIEAAIAAQPPVREVAVVARDDAQGRRLVAYVVGQDHAGLADTEWASGLRRTVAAKLPEYMVPALFLPLASLPHTTTGKLDRSALAAAEIPTAAAGPADADTPRTPVEEVLAGMMAEVLGVERVGIHDNFFELGGHSLLAAELVALIQDSFEVELPLLQLFDSATVSDLAECLLEDPLRRDRVEVTAPVLLQLAAAGEESPEDHSEAESPEPERAHWTT